MTAVAYLLGLAAGAFVFAKVADLFECPAAGDLFSWACGGLTAFALIALLLTSAGHRLALLWPRCCSRLRRWLGLCCWRCCGP